MHKNKPNYAKPAQPPLIDVSLPQKNHKMSTCNNHVPYVTYLHPKKTNSDLGAPDRSEGNRPIKGATLPKKTVDYPVSVRTCVWGFLVGVCAIC